MALLRIDPQFLARLLLPGVDCEIRAIEYAPDFGRTDVLIELAGPGVPIAKEVMAISVNQLDYSKPATVTRAELKAVGEQEPLHI